MLKRFKFLVKLHFLSSRFEKPQPDSVTIEAVIKYAIDQMNELRSLTFRLCDPIKLKNIQRSSRIYPLTIEIQQNSFITGIQHNHSKFQT
ncbi:hypothetical protein FGO68_gene371 [Halteria grandinella]|uniref:Uncharacterized protein n=1 Tax=Halteria grandinella TaxID=5974 RepID=A0A8J8T2Z3_HALGN|nr:hypothetical protein FGO68_gene371 [Halteria grandinella]